MYHYQIKEALDRLYRDFDFDERLRHDPIEFPHRYTKAEDIEIAGFISASLAYGRITAFKSVLEELFARMGESPYGFVRGFDIKRHASLLEGIKYRFNSESDMVILFHLLSEIIRRFRSLENAFLHGFDSRDIGTAIDGFRSLSQRILEKVKVNKSFWYLIPGPVNGSACKRVNLFLRWMVRDRDIDFGIWKGFRKDQLIIPLDTHIARIGQCLGFTRRKTADWRMAVEITEALKKMDPEDPLKYDFALCHKGVIGMCKGCKEKSDGCQVLFDGTLMKQR
ncbi:MAG: TIGR02757 family protein [Nitrospirae bacterium]|nr:TIGR02757 family protein [Nitrospirota bacterium]